MRSLSSLTVTLLGTLALSACVRGAPNVDLGSLVTDRPDFTESTQTVPRGYTQVEVGGTGRRESDVTSASIGEVLVRAGVAPRIELRLTLPSLATERSTSSTAHGLDDAGLGVKLALHTGPEAPGSLEPSVSLLIGTSLPTGSNLFGSSRALPEMKFLASWTITERVGFASNVNWARAEDSGAPHDEWSGSGSFSLALSARVGSYAEYFVFGDRASIWRRRDYLNGGLTYLVHDALQLDARAGVRIDGVGDGGFFGLGVSRRF